MILSCIRCCCCCCSSSCSSSPCCSVSSSSSSFCCCCCEGRVLTELTDYKLLLIGVENYEHRSDSQCYLFVRCFAFYFRDIYMEKDVIFYLCAICLSNCFAMLRPVVSNKVE